ncbi:hypothetical protein psal_cds_1401 [Pandoravirus salinus]|uniref:Uncharacterized protein n=1 Tax=Pandoravirus salinus TaxID=1349410 RepID=S4W1Y9_9VIRU|nr:hypothetical protein psal_cds_1401 [Pandoravirus salinus]AGO85831.2 hypothetical protein psal_cds_1401 [Pandoravirus salinus]
MTPGDLDARTKRRRRRPLLPDPHSPTTTLQTAGEKKKISDHVADDAKARANGQRHMCKQLSIRRPRSPHLLFFRRLGACSSASVFCHRLLVTVVPRCCFWAPLTPTRTADLQPFASLVFFVGSCSTLCRRPRPSVRS